MESFAGQKEKKKAHELTPQYSKIRAICGTLYVKAQFIGERESGKTY